MQSCHNCGKYTEQKFIDRTIPLCNSCEEKCREWYPIRAWDAAKTIIPYPDSFSLKELRKITKERRKYLKDLEKAKQDLQYHFKERDLFESYYDQVIKENVDYEEKNI